MLLQLTQPNYCIGKLTQFPKKKFELNLVISSVSFFHVNTEASSCFQDEKFHFEWDRYTHVYTEPLSMPP